MKGDVLKIGQTEYVVLAVKPYPNAKKRICDNILLETPDGKGKHWLADFAATQEESQE